MTQNMIVDNVSRLMHSSGEHIVTETTRVVDFSDVSYARISYNGTIAAGVLRFRVEYSLNNGSSWELLLPYGPNLTTVQGVVTGQWEPMPADVYGFGDILIRLYGEGEWSENYFLWWATIHYR